MYTPVAQRNSTVVPTTSFRYVPIVQRKAIPSPFQEVEPEKMSVEGFFKEVGQSIARNIGSAALTIATPKIGESAESLSVDDFQSNFGQALFETVFGKGQEIKPIETRIAEAEIKIPEWQKGLQETLDNTPNLNAREKFVLKTLANLNPKSTAFIGVMGSVGLDLSPFGGLEKNAFKAITKVSTIGDALILGRQMGIADDLLDNFAQQAVKVSNDADAEKLFKSTANLQQTTKTKPISQTGGYVPVAQRTLPTTPKTAPKATIVPKVDKSLEPLAAEARKYKSAEEFVKGFSKKEFRYDDTISGIVEPNYNARVGTMKLEEMDKLAWNQGSVDPKGIKKWQKRIEAGERPYVMVDVAPHYMNMSEKIPRIMDGHTRFEAYRDAGIKDIPVIDRSGKVLKEGTGLTDFYNKAVEEVKQLPIPEGLPKIPSILDKGSTTLPLQKQGQLTKTISNKTDSYRTTIPQKIKIATQKTTEGLQTKKVIKGELPKKITKTEPQLLKTKLKEQAKGAKAGFKAGKAEATERVLTKLRHATEATQEIKNDVVAIAKTLPSSERGKALVLVRDAKTPRDLTKAFARINRWSEDAEKTTIRNEILKTQKQIMDSPSIAIDYKARIKELMGDFELKGHREATLERLKKTQEFLQSELAKGNDIEVPRRVLKSLELLNRTPFEEITLNQLTGLKAEMELLEGLGRTKFRTSEAVWDIQKTKILDEITLQGSKPIKNIELIKPEIGERLTLTQKFKNLIWSAGNQAARIDKAISPMDTIFDLLDGGKGAYDGANFRFFKGQVDAGYGRYITRKDALQKPIFDLEAKYKFADTNYERIGVVAAREQDGGVEKLIASGFTKEQIDAVKLTTQEEEMLDLMRSTFDSQFPEIQDVMKKVYNQPVEKVKNYFSFMTDWKAMDEAEVFQRFGSQTPEQYGTPRKNVEAGFVKTRVGGDQKIKINAMDVFTQHTDNTSYLLELGETAKMLGEVAFSPQYAELVGDVGQLMVREWLDVIARKGGAAGASEIAILNTLRKNVGIGILGLKLSTIAIQPTALIDGMGFIGAKYGTKGATNFLTSKEWRKFILEMPEISDRMGGEFALRELTDDNWLQNIQRKGFIPMQKLDQITAGSIAAGAYERKMIELGLEIDLTKGFNKEALAYAQLTVRRTQSSGAFKDVPLAVSRGALTGNRSLDRAMLQFQNFLLTRWSRIRHDAIRAGINTKDPKKAIPIFTAIIIAALAGSGIRLGVNKVQDFITGREDEDSVAEDLQKGFMYEMTGNMPFVGTAVSMAMYDGEMFPILDAPKGVISGLNRVITSESEAAKLRGFTEFAGSMGVLLGVPGSAQTEQLIRGSLQDEKKSGGGLPSLPELPKLPKLPKLPSI